LGTSAQIGTALECDALWYKDALIYKLHVKAFCDSNDDGIGDFRGLASKLDYVQDLGVNTIWVMPFYPSPLRDDGYDVADYLNVHPHYGTRQDFRNFLREAHLRGLRVITELVVNHTSDQHPWFQAARRARADTSKRNFYVWSDDDQKYRGTRIIFTDTEVSNWTWDPVAKAYYWHRFFSHQPDLNFDNPSVLKAVYRAMRFWLDMGVDGFGLTAIPYLVEREGTNNENLPETHALIKKIRAAIDAKYGDRVLLAEANQWPEDVRNYFGDDDECHMVCPASLTARIHMAMAREDRSPIQEVLEQTPGIPVTCQWGVYLRNQDELALDMLTENEREYTYRFYAADPRARINLGIHRRLAPLMENDIARLKLIWGLLLAMPGTPILYYGDEIGMGDNIFLGDRYGLRTPMQWTHDSNAGFSRADPQRVYVPPIMDPIYGFPSVNVQAQLRSPSSLLNWLKVHIAVRRTSTAFGRGTLRFLKTVNRKVLTFVRAGDDESILCIFNLARNPQQIKLDLSEWRTFVPIEMTSRSQLSPIGERPYSFLLSPLSFYYIRLSKSGWVHRDVQEHREEQPSLTAFDFRGDDLSGVDFSQYSKLQNADLSDTNLRGVSLRGLDLSGADLRGANLVDAILDGATITGAKLWEAKRGGWSVRGVVCEHIFWDRDAQKATPYTPGEFERLFGEKGARVFLSSTLGELQAYRDAVYSTIENLEGFECIRMEEFGAIGDVPLKVCIDQVDASDVFVGILGHAYGSCPKGESRSFTELEYDAASGKPRHMFLADESLQGSGPTDVLDDSRRRQIHFRKRVRDEVVVATFVSPEDLAEKIQRSLERWRASKG
jgi:trehalose synthase